LALPLFSPYAGDAFQHIKHANAEVERALYSLDRFRVLADRIRKFGRFPLIQANESQKAGQTLAGLRGEGYQGCPINRAFAYNTLDYAGLWEEREFDWELYVFGPLLLNARGIRPRLAQASGRRGVQKADGNELSGIQPANQSGHGHAEGFADAE